MFDDPVSDDSRSDFTPGPGAPLPERMRPRTLAEFVGQGHLVGEGKPLRKLIEDDRFGSLILWGPPGCGKTTLARIIAQESNRTFYHLSAVESGIKELKKIIEEARRSLNSGKKSLLFLDEIHRYNKTQQDALLPHLESGLISLIGATTENPSFGVIPALNSRCGKLELRPLSVEQLREIIAAAMRDDVNGLGGRALTISGEAEEQLALMAGGDARAALGILEGAADATSGEITPELVKEIAQKSLLLYDKAGQAHYDHASAYQKSIRGSDPDGAIYWLARMLEAGEDPRFIARRLMICAAEDVGNADPTALILANSAADVVDRVGMPEGRIPLAQATIYAALAPKSNAAYMAINSAMEEVKRSGLGPQVPLHIRDASHKWHQENLPKYLYPHDHGGWVKQQHLPDELKNTKFFKPIQGRELTLFERLQEIKKRP